ncbi:hypothetical protein MalM25_18390 [Planctomycetes bacterium MalM25]|nr:hypothetical protein MalM25_18390 [Planctomycetes bacterium MalM25]
MYMSSNSGRLPRTEQDLRAYLGRLEGVRRAQLIPPDGSDLFSSARDGEPLVVAYRDSGGRLLYPSGVRVLAYESVGVDGYRELVNVYGNIERIEEDEFQRLLEAGNPSGSNR